ncbi:acetyl-CoA carboxylase biotin carboxylase subunit [Litorimonas sp. RW-G-Af-16]|uniref:acetyl-CoA carboxylase biotin carboxylase subunit n=1 Tax=Litorimonas sp. RW-G-Af-16 TaxID=3241168 RepID=UPI00390C4794
MIKKVLIANRGEIACRVIKTAQRLGIKTVAVYSDADRHALHVSMADEAIHIGPSAASESYLVMDKIMDAIKSSGADAVHPGYGFLSENPEFAKRLNKAGVTFIGPNPHAIVSMGDKITSKKLAQEAGVSCVPGHMDLIEDADEAVKIAKKVGYPVMIKASAGGGGKGMRIAYNDTEAREGFQSSKNEAANSFGDDRIFIEKFVEQPRHIEIQVLGDKHGNVIYLGERECSIQRRNQKVIEEAPSPFLDEKTRAAMGAESVALAKAVQYDSAGTVEFIVDKDKNFYFLEMNTRLQVEHPVTELITGVDLVEQMIRSANGDKLSMTQDDVTLNGWAIESRIYAEDPYRNFLPSIGRLVRYRPPAEGTLSSGAIIRNDTGVYEGGEISMFYDPMIAKLCTWGEDRGVALTAMKDALDVFELDGIGHNIPFLQAVYDHDRFERGDITTAFIAEEYPEGFSGAMVNSGHTRKIAAVCGLMHDISENRSAQISGALPNHERYVPNKWAITIGETDYTAEIKGERGLRTVIVDDINESKAALEMEVLTSWKPGMPMVLAYVDNKPLNFRAKRCAEGYHVWHRGCVFKVCVRTPRGAELAKLMPVKEAPDTSNLLLCPMPGVIVSVLVNKGDEVQDGQALAVVEAMKMENTLRAETKGIIAKINCQAGDNLAVDDVIMEFET